MPEQQFDSHVDAYIEKAAPFAQPILAHLRELMHRACPRATEAMKWSMPFFLQQGIILANMAAFKQHCAFGFWGPEMKKLLEKDGLNSSEAMGTLGRITNLKDLPSDKTLLAYMRHAGEIVESGQRTKSLERPQKPAKKKPVSVPPALAAALKKNKAAARAFAEFSPSGQREYCEWIAEAKRPETREKRLQQAVAQIAEGKSRNWKYENC
ncbi:MAG: YdeI/OmpD-associated family protein [Candidatus Acidiferrum sp.]